VALECRVSERPIGQELANQNALMAEIRNQGFQTDPPLIEKTEPVTDIPNQGIQLEKFRIPEAHQGFGLESISLGGSEPGKLACAEFVLLMAKMHLSEVDLGLLQYREHARTRGCVVSGRGSGIKKGDQNRRKGKSHENLIWNSGSNQNRMILSGQKWPEIDGFSLNSV
jgi:hypothetical protein